LGSIPFRGYVDDPPQPNRVPDSGARPMRFMRLPKRFTFSSKRTRIGSPVTNSHVAQPLRLTKTQALARENGGFGSKERGKSTANSRPTVRVTVTAVFEPGCGLREFGQGDQCCYTTASGLTELPKRGSVSFGGAVVCPSTFTITTHPSIAGPRTIRKWVIFWTVLSRGL
jgi:hypothetical protein